MKYLDEDLIKKLNIQQEKIINSVEELIMVEACPGAGKTYTIVRKIQKELLYSDSGIIACSFTNEASNELKKRISKKTDISNCFIGTIDSFILSEIIQKYLNRFLKSKNKSHHKIEIKKVVFPSDNKLVNRLTKFPENKNDIIQYYREWIKKLYQGIYEVSFASYLFAKEVVKSKYFSELYKIKYSSIYIDEAQDLNYYQHLFIDELRKSTKIKVIMVGDPNQSIYQFRGASPSMFCALSEKEYRKYTIDISVRCHQSISYYANKIVNIKSNYDLTETRIHYLTKFSINFFKELNGNFFIICETNEVCKKIYEFMKDKIEVYYIKALDIKDDNYNTYRNLIDVVLQFYFNCDNLIPKNIYPIDEYVNFLLNINPNITEDKIKKENLTCKDYLKKIFNLLLIEIEDYIFDEIDEKLKDDVYKYYYLKTYLNNRIMTIHSSKGLENNNVIICLENNRKFDEEYKNKLFVAITRAIDNVYFFPTKGFVFIKELKKIIPE